MDRISKPEALCLIHPIIRTQLIRCEVIMCSFRIQALSTEIALQQQRLQGIDKEVGLTLAWWCNSNLPTLSFPVHSSVAELDSYLPVHSSELSESDPKDVPSSQYSLLLRCSLCRCMLFEQRFQPFALNEPETEVFEWGWNLNFSIREIKKGHNNQINETKVPCIW